MYAVIKSGGKQHQVAEGDVINVERIDDDGEVRFQPLLVVDDEGNLHFADGSVTARVVGATKGPKVQVRKFRNKTGYRRRAGHRQGYTSLHISAISTGGSGREVSSDGT
ncbi:MAG: 50S ribosomal protein L21 [Actinobacteria bacterium]|nr:50S ribosomal protein L21 [Actinomycetota bacterium]MDQ3532959.1 50S ribosomal protein L21 [Actinomycetota bacterium]